MTKMEILALRGIADRLAARQKEPKSVNRTEDTHFGRNEGLAEGEREIRRLIEAAEEP